MLNNDTFHIPLLSLNYQRWNQLWELLEKNNFAFTLSTISGDALYVHTGKFVLLYVGQTIVQRYIEKIIISLLLASLASPILSVEREIIKMEFDDVVEILSTSSGYSVELIGDMPEHKIDIANINNNSLSVKDKFRYVLSRFGITSYVIETDEENYNIKIIIGESVASDNQIAAENALAKSSSALTLGQLQRIKEEHRIKMSQLTDDTMVSPPSEHGPGLTLGELKQIKESHKIELSLQTDETEIIPPSEYGPGLTLGELEAIKENHRIALSLQTDETEITPPSEYGPGLTSGELEAIKENHRIALSLRTDETNILPSSEYGPGLSLGELKKIKERNKASLGQQTEMTVILSPKEDAATRTRN